ncbi:LysR family transcriptional regulator [Rhizobium sp. Root1220]|uniref:LysR family transcriptional regulator n=1 Tax=Rhizobium sp. Root1220 TaxID=1736432 RepID=UPI0006FB2376|nr:LysR family transcriptional regulator [Rhizobium sp. Root1220]KQV73266.1 LysR family transcriptional regulator [Rhizobium sp. Root1220]
MDRLTSLSVFGKVVECGGFSAAARRLNMSVTMVGTHVQSLEERLGVRLLNRTTRKVSLTETGKFYYDRTAQILAELDDADRTAGALTTTPRGTLKLYANSAIVSFLLPVIDEFLALYPAISLNLHTGDAMIDMIDEAYDLAIRSVPSHHPSLIVRKLTPWRHVLVCAPAYLDNHAEPRVPGDLMDHDCLQYTYYPYGDEWTFEDANGQRSSVRVKGTILSNNAETLRHLAIAGRSVWLAPSFVVSGDLTAGSLVPLLPDHRGVELAINAVYPDKSHLPTKVRLFVDLIADRFAEHRKWMT